MTGPAFRVSGMPGGDLVADTDDPRLRGIRWWWTPDTGQVEYGLDGGHPVGIVNVWDYAAGAPGIAPTAEALAAHLSDRYADPDNVGALLDEIAHG